MVDAEKLLDSPTYFVEHYIGEEPFEYQEDFMDNPSSRKAFVSGRRVGKSRTAAWLALWKALTYAGAEVLVTAKAQRQSMELFNQIQSEMHDSKVDEEQWGVVRSTRTEINFDNGSRIIALPVGRDGSNIRGYGSQDNMIIVDEAAFIDDAIFQEVLSPMMAVGGGTFILLSTPFGKKGFLYERFNDDDWYTMQVPSSANPLIEDDEFIEEQRQNLTSTQFKQEILGQFVESADSFFTREEIMNCASESVEQSSQVTFLGVDLASTGGDESVYVCIDDDGNIFHIEHTTDKPMTDAMGRIRELDSYYDFNKIMVDSTSLGQGTVDEVQQDLGNKVEGFKFTNEKKQSLYNTLKNELQNGNLEFPYIPGKTDKAGNKLASQCLELEYSYTSSGKMRIEHPPGGHDDFCLDEETEILTSDGWKDIHSYNSEPVASYNKSGELVYQVPYNLNITDYSGEMYHFTGNMIDLMVTPNHKMVYQYKGKTDGNVDWKFDTCTADSFADTNINTIKSNRKIPVAASQKISGVDRTDEELSLLGWMITEGWKNVDSRWDTYRYSIGQSKDKFVDEIDSIVSSFNPYKYERSDGCIYWQFHEKDNEYFNSLLSDGPHRIPREILSGANKEQLKTLYESMMDGDGTRSRNTYHTQSEDLAQDFQELCHKIGKKASVEMQEYDTNFKDGYVGYNVYIHENSDDTGRISSVETKQYDGKVWCPSVKSGAVMCRRNGRIMITGNSDAFALAVWAKSQKKFARSDAGSMTPFTLGSLRD
jgi:hypothetical protein